MQYMLHTNYRNFKNKSQSIPAVLRVEFSFRFLFISFNIKVSNFYSPALQPYSCLTKPSKKEIYTSYCINNKIKCSA